MDGYTEVRKRDGRLVPFDRAKISTAISKALGATNEGTQIDALRVTEQVIRRMHKHANGHVPCIEEIQDIIESELCLMDLPATAKAFILYRYQRAELREKHKEVPEYVRDLVQASSKYFRNKLGEFVFYRTYARWLPEERRRETWVETVDRYIDFMHENTGSALMTEEYAELRLGILEQRVMPSMRLLQFAGTAARATNVAAFNCAFIAMSEIRDFAELMYLLMCGTGVGFSVESEFVNRFPQIKRQRTHKTFSSPVSKHVVSDSKEGWCNALAFSIEEWMSGNDVEFDYSQVRPAGARLVTMGGRASGPAALQAVLMYVRGKILSKQGRRLSNLDVHDICCKIGESVVVGGVRRSALISLSDLEDKELRDAKQGQFYISQAQRMMANNSAVYTSRPPATQFMEEWLALAKSGSGERGIFNRSGLPSQLPNRRVRFLREEINYLGTNPCGEIILQSKQFCNLSEVVVRAGDTGETLQNHVRLATILGTYQSSLTKFPYLSKMWKMNCEQERLLGVSLTGQWDRNGISGPMLSELREIALSTNLEYSKRMGINPSTSITCVKPSGTVSQLVDAASGLHPRHSEYYIRRIRIAANEALFQLMKDQKISYFPETGQDFDSATICVLEFPIKAPDGAMVRSKLSAKSQLEYWKRVKLEFTEHNPSVTISVGEDEWIEVANWLYENWNILGGLSFLPREDHVYRLAPYEEITKERYEELVAKMPTLDFSQIMLYEEDDTTDLKAEPACTGGQCEIDLKVTA